MEGENRRETAIKLRGLERAHTVSLLAQSDLWEKGRLGRKGWGHLSVRKAGGKLRKNCQQTIEDECRKQNSCPLFSLLSLAPSPTKQYPKALSNTQEMMGFKHCSARLWGRIQGCSPWFSLPTSRANPNTLLPPGQVV